MALVLDRSPTQGAFGRAFKITRVHALGRPEAGRLRGFEQATLLVLAPINNGFSVSAGDGEVEAPFRPSPETVRGGLLSKEGLAGFGKGLD